MSESVLERLSFPDDIDRPPPKKLKLDSSQSSDLSPNFNQDSNSSQIIHDDFDPVQAILDAGKRCREEDDTGRNTVEELSPSKDDDLESVEDSDDDIDTNPEESKNEKPPKASSSGSKSKGVGKSGKKKSSHMRRNIKDILQHDQLDDLTIAARKEEEERRQRMNLKLQQLQQQQLKFLQHQQSQLLRESLNSGINYNLHHHLSAPSRPNSELKKLIQKKHITVSLNESGLPSDLPKAVEDECILLSSDDECEKSFHAKCVNSLFSHIPSPGVGSDPSGIINKFDEIGTDIIAISSDDENHADDSNRRSANANRTEHLYAGGHVEENVRGIGDTDVESDDDCVIISTGPDTEDEVEEKDECSQDLINVPDHLGRVLVNVGHPDEDEDMFMPPQIAKIIKPHQIGGVRFLYDNVIESKYRYNNSAGFGCILAHAMGLGKTLQTVSFCDVFLRTVGKTVLIIVPINTIQNWLNEFNRYLPLKDDPVSNGYLSKAKLGKNSKGTENGRNGETTPDIQNTEYSNLSQPSLQQMNLNGNSFNDTSSSPKSTGHEFEIGQGSSSSSANGPMDIRHRKFEVYLLNETVKSLQARERIITTWTAKGGVLLLGYEMYRMLALKKLKKSGRKAMSLVHEERVAEAESLDKIYEYLVDPGPNCVICDEGHRIKNSGAGISQALKSIKTKRRVVLTGYPLQNNLMEYWCMVDFVRPNYLGTKAEFSNMFERPIQNGQCADSTCEDKRLMKYRSHVLHSLLEGFVQRRSHLVLKNALPHKEEYVFLVKLTPIQLKIYREFIRYLRDDLDSDNASANPIKAFAVCCKIWNHPDVLWNVVKKNLDLELDLDIDEVRPANSRPKPKSTGRPRGRPPLNGLSMAYPSASLFEDTWMEPVSIKPETTHGHGISLEWAKPLFENYTPELMENGVKFELLFELIKETVLVNDKLLVFSQSLLTLDLIEVFLKKRLNWRKFCEYVRLDGSTAGLERERLINQFNTTNEQKLFLISTRAGSLGINLVGANRVCIFDASWNPCHDSQAVCRIYRYGQTKACHIYRFVSDCTLEKRIYDRQVNKKGMADRIVDEMNPNTPFKSKDVSSFLVLEHDLLDKLPYIRCDINFEKFTDPVLQNLLLNKGDKITQEPFEHESLLIDQKHQRLSKSEKRLALKNYEKEKKTVANAYASYSRPSYAQYYTPGNTTGAPSTSYSPSSLSRYNYHKSLPNPSLHGNSRVSSASHGSMGNSTFDKFELHINALKSRGISVFPVELHQDTFLKDPTGTHDIFLRAGDRVFILVSQKGTYLRAQGKLLRVPYVGTEMNQEQAEHFVMSLLQASKQDDRSHRGSYSYPVEQQLPPSNLLFQKNANHLQITNSRNNSGGDVMMAPANWSGKGNNLSSPTNHHSNPHMSQLLSDSSRPRKSKNRMIAPHAQPDLQSLSKLESFCHSSSSSFSDLYSSPNLSKAWMPPSTKAEGAPELEVIKLNHSQSNHSSNSSNSSNSRTNSPYRQSWSNSSDANSPWGREVASASAGKSDAQSFYTDFTITPVGTTSSSSNTQQLTTPLLDKTWQTNDHQFLASEYFKQALSREVARQSNEPNFCSFADLSRFSSVSRDVMSAQNVLNLSATSTITNAMNSDDRGAMNLSGRSGALFGHSNISNAEDKNRTPF